MQSLFLSLFLILFCGTLIERVFKKIRIPPLIGLRILGILFGAFDVLSPSLLSLSGSIRKIALIIILAKAGLSLDRGDLKKVGRPAILLSFLPAVVERCAVGVIGHFLFPLSWIESFLLGSVLGAVSPAVVIPRRSKLRDEGYGTKEGIPQLIIAGSSIDDIIRIVFFQCFLTREKGGEITPRRILDVPLSIVLGVSAGILLGFFFSLIRKKLQRKDTFRLILLFAIGFGLTAIEEALSSYVSFSSLLAILTRGILIKKKVPEEAKGRKEGTSRIWDLGEIFLFILIGAAVKIDYAKRYFGFGALLILCSLLFRSLAVQASLIKTKLNAKERLFVSLSYLPKATVQAAIGGTLLDYGTERNNPERRQSGRIVLSLSVIAILLSAPIGAISRNSTYKRLLKLDSAKN